MRTLLDHLSQAPAPRGPALLIWSAIWLILLAADPWLDLANLSLILLTGSVAASLWLAPLSSIIVSTASVIAFNWLFVPPPFRQKGTIKDITEMYWLSGPGGWPKPVYAKP